MSNLLDTLRASARAEVLRLVAEHDNRPWRDTGRYEPLPCRGCGRPCESGRLWCAACGEVP